MGESENPSFDQIGVVVPPTEVGHDVAFCLPTLEHFVHIPCLALAYDLELDLFSRSPRDVLSFFVSADTLHCIAHPTIVCRN